jgi:hypothetical protein
MESRGTEWGEYQWELLRKHMEGSKNSSRLFDLDTSESGSDTENKESRTQWDKLCMRKALTCHYWGLKGKQ